ncbi:MAG: undecaprenyldiphospho-muramoylpentapeptide beta-N-acetylglucosaminyltransferase [Candidatus Margulisbacteria bacterium]|jgi:UDP-N-acetylglucosamine--N-acetylmuramyl-(pentapeptide) pyrophosphoryl-undecaprenol N-acetylglucosamine transferase|nr:undecaprenyldiphospho-muramoylpentapeptide beta-N-acetylglucosaminyltransferase [Candidatus Margulisiibacteriota bacterium]
MSHANHKIVIVAGGTGGHIYPGIAVAQALEGRGTKDDILFIGSEEGLEKELIPRAGFRLKLIKARQLTRRVSYKAVTAPLMMVIGFFQALALLAAFTPRVVLSFGGYTALPVVLAAKALGIKVFVHEQNVLPGATNQLTFRLADRIFLSFPESLEYCQGEVVGNPVRAEIFTTRRSGGSKKVLLVLGGSQGASRLNQAVAAALPNIDGGKWEIVHSLGRRDFPRYAALKNGFYRPLEYIDNMAAALVSADLVISRAGATAIAEFTAAGLPMVLVPYPYAAAGHQDHNADALVKAGAALKIADRDFTAARLLALLEDGALDLAALAARSRKFARPEAAKRIAEAIWT